MTTRLVSFTTCPYVQRALLAFHEKGVEPDVLYMMGLAYDHPTPVEKARAYAVPAADLDVELMPGDIPLYVWSVTTNLLHQGWPWMMLLRSFAILFSNMALERMAGRSATFAAP